MSARFIPTVERESVDVIDKFVAGVFFFLSFFFLVRLLFLGIGSYFPTPLLVI